MFWEVDMKTKTIKIALSLIIVLSIFMLSFPSNSFSYLYQPTEEFAKPTLALGDLANKYREGGVSATKSADKQDSTQSTFAANIYDIYTDSFFVDDLEAFSKL